MRVARRRAPVQHTRNRREGKREHDRRGNPRRAGHNAIVLYNLYPFAYCCGLASNFVLQLCAQK